MVGRLLRPVKPPRPSPPAELPHLSGLRIVPLFRGLPGGVSSGPTTAWFWPEPFGSYRLGSDTPSSFATWPGSRPRKRRG